jgi:hypothetical protein
MIRFTWLQSRTQTAMAAGALAIAAVVLAVTGPHLVHLYSTSVATCAAHGDCPAVTAAFLRNDRTLRTWLGILAIVIPGIIGIFWGAPLVARELEAGTFRLAWTQSVTRTRWLAVKLGVIGLASMAAAGLLSLMLTWWASPLDRARLNQFGTFDQRDIVPIGYAAFAFALGVAAGARIRRTLPAMATTLVAFLAARLAMTYWIRPHLIAPAHQDFAINSASIVGYGSSGSSGTNTLQLGPPSMPNAWIYSTQLIDKTGHAITAQFTQSACAALVAPPRAGGASGGAGIGSSSSRIHAPAAAQNALHDCSVKVAAKFHEVVTYQPASRYWAFQWYELAIFLGAAVLLAGACIWQARRRLS